MDTICALLPGNKRQVLDALAIEADGFTGDDPPETDPDVIRFLASKGKVFLFYADTQPVAIIELLPIASLIEFAGSADSPLAVIAANRERVFGDVLLGKAAIYHHGIATMPAFRRHGYARKLLSYAIKFFAEAPITCFIEAGILKGGEFIAAANEPSLRLHSAAGFKFVRTVYPPVYDERNIYHFYVREPA